MYAIIKTGGRQVVASPGEVIQVERLAGEPGETVEFNDIAAISGEDGALLTGEAVAGAKVTGVIEAQARGPKVIVFKFKRRKMYRRRQGHRQALTAVKIDSIAG